MSSKNLTRLSDLAIKALRPGPKVIDYPDSVERGLVLRAWPSGQKTWGVRYWWQGKSTRLSLGSYPDLSLKSARALAADARKAKRDGRDPREALFPEPDEDDALKTLRDAAQGWLKDQRAHKRRSADHRYRVLELHVLPVLGDQPIGDIKRKHVAALLTDLRDLQGLKSQVNRVHTMISGIFSWALDEGLIDTHPVARMRSKVPEDERELVLSLDQLVTIWNAAGEISSIAGDVTRLLILLACRREEATGMGWGELNLPGGLWNLPANRTKNKHQLTIPLPPAAVKIIERQPRWPGGNFVFSARRGETSFKGWKSAAAMLRDKAALVDGEGLPLNWRVHDLRRAVATALASDPLRASEELVARVLAHSDRARRGVTATYDRSERLGEVGDALRAWAEHILAAVADGEKVVELRQIGAGAKKCN